MADKATPLINNLNGGEISPQIDARSDISKYYSGCRTLVGAIPHVEGGASRTPGTYFVHEIKMPSKKSRIVPFHFSTVQAYAIEFGDQYIRFYMDDGIILDGVDVYEIASPYLEADLFKLKFAQSADIMYIFHPSYITKKLTRTAHTSWTLTNFVAGVGDKMTITGITKANPAVVTFEGLKVVSAVSAITNKFTLVNDHGWLDNTPVMISTTGTLPAPLLVDTVYYVQTTLNTKKLRLAYTAFGGAINLTTAGTGTITLYDSSGIIEDGDIVYINDVVGMTEVNDQFFTVANLTIGATRTFKLLGVDSSLYGAYASGGWARMALFGTTDNHPSCGAFFGQRLAVAGSGNNPQRLDASASGDYEEFTPDPDDDSAAIQYTLASGKVDRIRWMTGEDVLLLGTTGGVWKFVIPVTPTTIPPSALKQIYIGVQDIEPKAVGDFIFWVTRSGLSLRQINFEFGLDKYVSMNMTRLASHITLGDSLANSGIVDMDYQQEPIQILWAVRADGQLLGFVVDSQEKVFAWFRVVTDGLFESVAVISKDGEEDQVWVVVNRTIGGETVRYVEYFMPHEFYSIISDSFFVHSGLSYDGGEQALISGITKANPAVVTVAAWPTDETELVDFAAAGWNEDGVKWKFLNGNLDHTNSDATAITATLGATIVAAHAYKVVLRGTGGGAACAYTLGGVAGTAIPASGAFTITDYITATGAGSLVITPGAASTVSFSSISVQELDYIIAVGNKVNISGVVGMTEVNIGNTTAHTVGTVSIANRTFQLSGVNSSLYTAWSSGGVVKIVKNAFTAPDLVHLAEKTVDALIDGVPDTGLSVSIAGAVTLNYYGNQIHVGLPFISDVEPMKLHAGSQAGTARGKKQRVNKVTCCFYETGEGVQVGPDSSNMKEVLDLNAGKLNTIDSQFSFFSNWEDEATLYIRQNKPLPMTVLALVPRISLNED